MNSRSNFLPGILLAAGSFIFLFLTRAAAQYGDSLNRVWSVRTGQGLFHPHHLIFNFVLREIYRLSLALGFGLSALDVAQLHNILWSVIAVVSVYSLGRRVFGSRVWSILAALILLVSQGFWEYATQAQSYAPAIGSMALFTLVLVRKPIERIRASGWMGIAVVLAVAILYHQGNILFVFPLAVFILASMGRRGWMPLLETGGLSGALVLGSYITGFVINGGERMVSGFVIFGGERTVSGFFRFVFANASYPAPSWGTWRNFSPRGVGYLLFSQLRCLLTVWRPIRPFLLAGLGIGLAVLIAGSFVLLRRRGAQRPWRAYLLSWLVIEYAFYLWWAPYDKAWFIVTVIPIIFLSGQAVRDLGLGLPARPRARLAAAAMTTILIAALAAFNYITCIRPLQMSLGPDYEEARLAAHCAAGNEYILSNFGTQAHLRLYFDRHDILEIEIVPLSVCQDLALPKAYERLAEMPFILPYIYLLPQTRIFSMIDGYDSPAGWKRYLEWIFDVRKNAGGEAVDCRVFTPISCAPGYLRIGLDRLPLSGWADLLYRLDAIGAASLGVDPGSFKKWAGKTGVLDPSR